jgi:dGTPase
MREHEDRWLSPSAVRSYETRGRAREEEPCRLRTPFQRDRDRIVHSKAFRRLRNKTQVWIDPAHDHFRTRLTHTLERPGSCVASPRSRLNEDPSRHRARPRPRARPSATGEDALDEQLANSLRRGFRHNEHSLRVVDVLERDGRART